jgi:hypothetical protein
MVFTIIDCAKVWDVIRKGFKEVDLELQVDIQQEKKLSIVIWVFLLCVIFATKVLSLGKIVLSSKNSMVL